MNSNKMPGWLVLMLALVAVVVLGPPALGILLGAVGVAIALAAVLLKVGLVVLVIYAFFALLRAVFGRSATPTASLPPHADGLETIGAQLDMDERARRAALDRELEVALRQAQAR